MRVVEGLVAVAHVYVEEGERVAGEPAGLETDCAAANGPFGAVCGSGHAAAYECTLVLDLFRFVPSPERNFEMAEEGKRTWIHPLHSIWEPRR